MEVTKPPPVDPSPSRADAGALAAPPARPGVTPVASAAAELGLAVAATALADVVQIHPLDVAGALQILVAEVRAELPLPGTAPHDGVLVSPLPAASGLPLESLAATAPRTLVQLFLQALPAAETLEPAAWLTAVMQAEGALHAALERAVATVTAWRDVPAAVVDAARQTRAVVVAAVTAEPPNPLWLRPEWLGLAPRLERYRRRRERARRWLSDPDLHWRDRDEEPGRQSPANDESGRE